MTTASSPSPMQELGHAVNDPRLSDGDCALLIELYQYHSSFLVKGVKLDELAAALGVSKRTISSRVSSLVRAGYVRQFILGKNLPPSYYLSCFAPNSKMSLVADSETQDSSSSIVVGRVERKDLPSEEGLSSLEPTDKIQDQAESLMPNSEEIPALPASRFSKECGELVKLIGRHRLGSGVSKLIYFQDDEAISKEVLLCRRFLINIAGGKLDDTNFGRQIESMLNAKHLHNPDALDELRKECQSRLDKLVLGSNHRRMAEIELEFIDEVVARASEGKSDD